MLLTIPSYTHSIASIVSCVISFAAHAALGAWLESPEAHFTVELIIVQDLFPVVEAQI